MKIIIGLGNKGSEYQKTRHNIGEYVVQTLVRELGETLQYDKYTLSNMVKTTEGDIYMIPELYVNESGRVIDGLFKDVKDKTDQTVYDNLLVVRDDMDMPIGSVKFVFDSGSGGHNGIKDIEAHLKSKKYWQLKIGILPVDTEGVHVKPVKDDVSDFVVGKFSKVEWEKMEEITKKAIEKVKEFVRK
jgi:PTH1 family peptidyl-tRNA hydrolase